LLYSLERQAHAPLAQLVERCPYMANVIGSNPIGCTNKSVVNGRQLDLLVSYV
jgi:hypothetical protein